MNKAEQIEEIKRIINLDGEEYTDRECLDMLWEFLEDEDEKIKGLWYLLNTPMNAGRCLDNVYKLIEKEEK